MSISNINDLIEKVLRDIRYQTIIKELSRSSRDEYMDNSDPVHAEIVIKEQNLVGRISTGNGTFQGFVVELNDRQLQKLKPKVKYKIISKNKSNKYQWHVAKDVYLIRP